MYIMNTYLAEAVGSFVFFTIVLSNKDPIMIAVGLLVAILLASIASQSHLNPAISLMAYLKKDISMTEMAYYILSQVVGAYLAIQYVNILKNK